MSKLILWHLYISPTATSKKYLKFFEIIYNNTLWKGEGELRGWGCGRLHASYLMVNQPMRTQMHVA
jgi:hypothetical protein